MVMCPKPLATMLLAGTLTLIGPVAVAASPSLTMAEAISFALSHQPDYLAAKLQLDQAKTHVVQAGAVPNPQLQALAQNVNPLDQSQTQYAINLQQTFQFGNQIGLKQDMARLDVQVAELAVQQTARGLMTAIAHAYNRVLAAKESLSVAQANLNWQRQLLALTNERIKIGELAGFERIRSQVQVAQAERDAMAADSEWIAAKQALNVQIGRAVTEPVEPNEPFVPAVSPLPDVTKVTEQALNGRSEILQSDATLARALANRRLIATQILPGMDVQLGGGATSGIPGANAQLQAVVPLWYRQDGELAEADLEQERLKAVRESLANGIRLQVQDAWRHLQMAGKQITLYQTSLLPSAKQLVDQTLERYRLGDASGQELVEVRKTYRETYATFVQAVLEYRNAKSDLALATGSKEEL